MFFLSLDYQKSIDNKNENKISQILAEMPPFVKDYFNSRRADTTSRTRLVYAYDLRKFFNWLSANNPEISAKGIKAIDYDDIEKLNARDIEDFVTFLISSPVDGNDTAGIARKLSSLSSFFGYLEKHEIITKNPCNNVNKPKVHNIEIIKLTPNEITKILDTVQYGCRSFSEKQEAYLAKTRQRDYAIFVVFLTTGIRVSELVGLNCSDLYLDEFRMVVRRKGGNIASVYLSDEARDVLIDYLEYRKTIENIETDALFISMQKTRLSVQTVENMIKKYAQAAGINKKITPHKLRKTYGTELYKETGDIYLVASSLGHSSVATTTRHYAVQDEMNKIEARNKIKLSHEDDV